MSNYILLNIKQKKTFITKTFKYELTNQYIKLKTKMFFRKICEFRNVNLFFKNSFLKDSAKTLNTTKLKKFCYKTKTHEFYLLFAL